MRDDKLHAYLTRVEAPELVETAAKIVNFDLGKRPTFGSAANFSGVRSGNQTFSQRRDSFTMFADDNRYGPTGEAGAWTGPDKAAIAACRRVMRAARIATAEIDGIGVLLERGVVAERLPKGEIRVERPELLRKLARARRALEGLHVWSSYVLVGLTRKGEIGHLELHWPRLPAEVVKEATLLRTIAKRGFEPPEVTGTRIESIEAGIIHSPAIGFLMDVTAAIRVVYTGDVPTIGRKPTRYFDRHGEPVSLPRDIMPTRPDELKRAAP